MVGDESAQQIFAGLASAKAVDGDSGLYKFLLHRSDNLPAPLFTRRSSGAQCGMKTGQRQGTMRTVYRLICHPNGFRIIAGNIDQQIKQIDFFLLCRSCPAIEKSLTRRSRIGTSQQHPAGDEPHFRSRRSQKRHNGGRDFGCSRFSQHPND
ncbi:MAG: hypothetical protein A2286_10085 [Gammaproteobacteria bacterium RIFOXYA12_FULL_61_12]|nr:MAG: hypothetical protein A2286_10085 [Gammaproteobacteria bacterium RIFOXYA12_FULL_61_12]